MSIPTQAPCPSGPGPWSSSFHQTCQASLRVSRQLLPVDLQTQHTLVSLQQHTPLNAPERETLRRSLVSTMSLVERGQLREVHLSLSDLEDALATLRQMRCTQAVQA